MAKKKKSQRKRNFAYSGSTQPDPKPATAATKIEKSPVVDNSKLSYVQSDLKKVALLALICVGIEPSINQLIYKL
jgi:hypothetical protein